MIFKVVTYIEFEPSDLLTEDESVELLIGQINHTVDDLAPLRSFVGAEELSSWPKDQVGT